MAIKDVKYEIGIRDIFAGGIGVAIGVLAAYFYGTKPAETPKLYSEQVNLMTEISAILDEIELPKE